MLPRDSDFIMTPVSVTAAQVGKALRETDPGKATSPDGISSRVLKNCAKELSEPLTNIFTACLEEKWPAVWKEGNVVPVHS